VWRRTLLTAVASACMIKSRDKDLSVRRHAAKARQE
jgi:hypothetical protein